MTKMENKENMEAVMDEIFGKRIPEREVLRMIMQEEEAWEKFSKLTEEQKQPLLDYFMGKSSLLVTYDTFFREVMSPEKHPKRLESFLGAILNEKVRIKEVLTREGPSLSDDCSLVIMDLVVEIGDGRIVNLEMQKVGLYFPGERSEVYAADLIMRQYTRIKNRLGKDFMYSKMAPVYIIVLMDKSSREFLVRDVRNHCIHRRQVSYDSGAELRNLENIIYISLDTFREKLHNKGIRTKQDAWLAFFSSARAEDIVTLINKFPEFREYYSDIAAYRRKPEEVIRMYSEMIAFLDKNTVQYMVEDMSNQISVLKKANEEKDVQIQDLKTQKQEWDSQKLEWQTQRQEMEAKYKELIAENERLRETKASSVEET